jgi:PAS domain-containing protein
MHPFDYLDLPLGLLLLVTAFMTSLAALVLVVRLTPPRRVTWSPLEHEGDPTAFLFDDEDLVDATSDARALLAHGPEQMEDFPRLAAVLSPRFPDLAERLSSLGRRQSLEIESSDGQTVLAAEWRSGLTRIALRPREEREAPLPDSLALAAMEDELADLRTTIDAAPVLIWKEDAGGAVRWANAAYIELALRADPESETLSWPLPRLFPASDAEDAPGGRLSLELPRDEGDAEGEGESTETLVFDATRARSGDATMVFATPADRLARAEGQHREFMQTLVKTFAHLPIGLALFDRDRRLAVFNPALTDLSGLQPLFLSRRPTLFDFLDALREARRMPEPKDYREWRRRIVEMEAAAANGTHIETWALPDGTTFRVTGRPHPDGAIAFLFEDITSEVTLTRRFRSELELGQAVVDAMPEAIAVFGPSRALVLSNTAYESLWDDDTTETLVPATLAEAVQRWRAAASPTPVWDEIAAFAANPGSEGWSREVRLADGRGLVCRVAPLAGAGTLVGFTPRAPGAGRLAPVEGDAAGDVAGGAPWQAATATT